MVLKNFDDWANEQLNNYSGTDVSVLIRGGNQICLNTLVLNQKNQILKTIASELTKLNQQLKESSEKIVLIRQRLGNYLPSNWFSAQQLLQSSTVQSGFLAGVCEEFSDKIQTAVAAYQQQEAELNRKHFYSDNQVGGGLLGGNLCQVAAAGDISCDPAPWQLEVSELADSGQKTSAASGVKSLFEQLLDVPRYENVGQLRIIKHQSGNQTSWTVLIPGTQNWGILTSTPQDMSSNLQNDFGYISDMTVCVQAALEQAGYQSGQAVELVGHSQGGAVAYQMVADRRLQEKYKVVSVLTLGSNIGGHKPQGNAHVLSLQNDLDIVPGLDLEENYHAPNLTTVVGHYPDYQQTINSSLRSITALKSNIVEQHDRKRYLKLGGAVEKTGDRSYQNWAKARKKNLGLGTKTVSTSKDYRLERKVEF